MTYPVVPIVNTLLDRAEKKNIEGMTPMKIQKLLYYAQAWYLKLNNGIPLIDEYFSRWKYGPVIPSLYHSLKQYGPNDAKKIFQPIMIDGKSVEYPVNDEGHILDFLDRILDVYGKYTGSELSAMTHKEGTAWENGRNGRKADGSVILLEDMQKDIE